MATIDREIELGLSKDLKELMYKVESYEEAKRVYTIIRSKIDPCRDSVCTDTEAWEYNIHRGGIISSLLGAYRKLLEKEKNDTN
jgi:hypothetical protein